MRDYQDIITVAVVNFRAFWGEKERNLSRIIGYIEQAAKRGADVICLPELALTGYENEPDVPLPDKMQVKLAETADGPSVQAVAEVTQKHGVYAVFGMPERSAEDPLAVYNAAVACGPEGIIGCYRKMHPANDESAWCKKGDNTLTLDTKWGPIGVGICYDTYNFHEVMRYHAALGARLYLNPTAMPIGMNGTFDWRTCYYDTMKSGVVGSDIFIASSNLVGVGVVNEYFCNEMGNETVKNPCVFAGASLIMGPGFAEKAHLYAGGPDEREAEVFMATLDLSCASRMIYNINPYTGTPDYRPDMYVKLNEKLLEDPYWAQFAEKE